MTGPSYIAPPTGRPAGPPPAPVFATTGNARADSVLATLDATIAPFTSAPPPEQGAAGWVAQGLGGALGLVNAPMMFIDAAASQGVSALLDALGLSGLFPPMPVATIGLSMHLGTPHTHVHPPSLVPPAPPIPLPSMGVAFLAGSASVLVGGVPALRAGDIGIGFTCGSAAPPFEIMTGASGVYFGGSRVARFGMDITFHCNPASAMGGFAIGMGVAGIVAGVAGAAAQASAGNAGAAAAQGIQAGLDAAAMAVSMLRGKDPAGPPGVGLLLGPPMGNVLAGGPPIPNVGALAQGKIYSALGRALRSARGAMRRRSPAPDANARACDAGEPVHVVTGANYNTYRDFASLVGGFSWTRSCSSARAFERGVVGWGWRHCFESHLQVHLHRVVFFDASGSRVEFPRPRREEACSMHGYRLRQQTRRRWTVTHRRLGCLTFEQDTSRHQARLVGITGDAQTVELGYDQHRRLERIVERVVATGDAATYTLRYTPDGQLDSVMGSRYGEPEALLVQYAYDDAGHLIAAADPTGHAERFAYDKTHRMRRATDRTGYSFVWEYDHEGRCVRTQGEDGLWAAAFEYLQDGQTNVTIHDGSSYAYHYDEDGVITKVVGPLGSVKQRIRDPAGRVVADVEPGGQRFDYLYDGDGGHIARRDAFGHTFPPSPEAPGLPRARARRLPTTAQGFLFGDSAVVAGAPRLVDEQRDLRGNVVQARDDAGATLKWTFDAQGNPTGRTDRDGRTHRTQIISWGLIGAAGDPLGNTARFHYNPHQRVVAIVDPGGTESRYVRDSHDRIVQVHRHGQLHESYTWDQGHRLVQKTAGDGTVLLEVTSNDIGLAIAVEHPEGDVSEYDYDAAGRTTRAANGAHLVQRAWNSHGQQIADDCDDHSVRHHHSSLGVSRTVVGGAFELQYHRKRTGITLFDAAGRAWSIRREREDTLRIDHPGGLAERQRFDRRGRLLERQTGTGWHVRYYYSPHGDLQGVTDSVRGDVRYQVDAAHRLTEVRQADHAALLYAYDAAGNLVECSGLGRRHLAPGNQLRAVGAEQFTYDDRHRMSSRRVAEGHATRYVYDSQDQLIEVQTGTEDAWTATYDALGRRVSFGRAQTTQRLWWDGDRVAASENADGQFRVYLYATADAWVPLGFTDFADRDASPATGKSYSVLSDQVGLPLQILDANGAVVWWAEHTTPYGEIFVRPGSAIRYDLRFAGHLYDPDLGLHLNRFRDYDPRLGRYLQPDPIGCAGGLNLYAYAPNPVVIVDLLGLAHRRRDTDGFIDGDGDGRPRHEIDPEIAAILGDGDADGMQIRGEPTQVEANRVDGARREVEAIGDLAAAHPDASLETQRALLDQHGNEVLDPQTFEGRRLDIVVVEDGPNGPEAIDTVEVTSLTASKTEQLAREQRIRDAGGTFIRTSDGDLVEVPASRLDRRP